MKKLSILPSTTRPWRERISRRHAPDQVHGEKGYVKYRACLRWEFGFSCAFCLCHETDLMLAGAEGWGLTQVEHFRPQKLDASARNDYNNCFYICGRCNRSRSKAPVRDDLGRNLLNPCDSAWGDLFFVSRDHLLARANPANPDASHTQATYRLNDRYKVRLRTMRREIIEDRRGFLERSNRYLTALLEKLATGGNTEEVEFAREITHRRREAARDLLKYRAIPRDRDATCRCDSTPSLPQSLDEQTFDLVDLLRKPASPPVPSEDSK